MQGLAKFADRVARRFGMALYVPSGGAGQEYALFKYTRPDGTFDYASYKSIQEAGNRRKLHCVYADERTMDYIAAYLKAKVPSLKRGICHGTRGGKEQQWLSDRTGASVVGTEISETAQQFPNTVQWDFHEEKPDWVGAFDFVYSNSHDHAYDPRKAFTTWARQLKRNGVMILEHTSGHHEAYTNELDPFGVRPEILPYLIAKWGGGAFAVTEVLEPPFKKPGDIPMHLFVIRRTTDELPLAS